MTAFIKDDTELFKQFSDDPEFKRWLSDSMFAATYQQGERDAALTRGCESFRRERRFVGPMDSAVMTSSVK